MGRMERMGNGKNRKWKEWKMERMGSGKNGKWEI